MITDHYEHRRGGYTRTLTFYITPEFSISKRLFFPTKMYEQHDINVELETKQAIFELAQELMESLGKVPITSDKRAELDNMPEERIDEYGADTLSPSISSRITKIQDSWDTMVMVRNKTLEDRDTAYRNAKYLEHQNRMLGKPLAPYWQMQQIPKSAHASRGMLRKLMGSSGI